MLYATLAAGKILPLKEVAISPKLTTLATPSTEITTLPPDSGILTLLMPFAIPFTSATTPVRPLPLPTKY